MGPHAIQHPETCLRGLLPWPTALSLLCFVAAALPGDESKPADAGHVLFRQHIQPILIGKCLNCHSPDKKRGGLDLSRRASLLVGGESGPAFRTDKPEESLLLRRLLDHEMPPENSLPTDQVEVFRRWLAAGAPF